MPFSELPNYLRILLHLNALLRCGSVTVMLLVNLIFYAYGVPDTIAKLSKLCSETWVHQSIEEGIVAGGGKGDNK